MVEVINHAQISDKTAQTKDKGSDNMGNIAVGAWQDKEKMSVGKKFVAEDNGTKCLKFDDIYGGKGGCGSMQEVLPGKPNKFDNSEIIKKPTEPVDGGLKDPIQKYFEKGNGAKVEGGLEFSPEKAGKARDGGMKDFDNLNTDKLSMLSKPPASEKETNNWGKKKGIQPELEQESPVKKFEK